MMILTVAEAVTPSTRLDSTFTSLRLRFFFF